MTVIGPDKYGRDVIYSGDGRRFMKDRLAKKCKVYWPDEEMPKPTTWERVKLFFGFDL